MISLPQFQIVDRSELTLRLSPGYRHSPVFHYQHPLRCTCCHPHALRFLEITEENSALNYLVASHARTSSTEPLTGGSLRQLRLGVLCSRCFKRVLLPHYLHLWVLTRGFRSASPI
ncbi:unnamed protein product [Ectocarpus sp. 4 AP-2014]